MREIKFRGLRKHAQKSIDKSYWVFGYYNFEPKSHIAEIIFNDGGITVHNETVGQYTGLKDKNGVEIYEGDIVRILYTDWPSKNESDRRSLEEYLASLSHKGIVTFNDNRWELSMYSDKYKDWSGSSIECGKYGFIEVVGNTHQNPELLTKEN